MSQWNELSRKTVGIIIAMGVLFAGAVITIVFILLNRYGGQDVARIVKDSVESQRITVSGEGTQVVSDKILVTFREGATDANVEDAARQSSVHIVGKLAKEDLVYVVSFPPTNVRGLRQLISNLEQHPDVVEASMIPVE